MAATYFIFSFFFGTLSLALVVLSYKLIRHEGQPTQRFNLATLSFGLSHITFIFVPVLHEWAPSFQISAIVLGNLFLVYSAIQATFLYREWRDAAIDAIAPYVWFAAALVMARLTYLQYQGTFADRVLWMTGFGVVMYGWQMVELWRNRNLNYKFQRFVIMALILISALLLTVRGQVVAGNVGHQYTNFLTEGIITIGIQWGWCTLVILNYLVIGSVYIEKTFRDQARLTQELEDERLHSAHLTQEVATSEELNLRLQRLLEDRNALLKRLSMAEKTGMLGALASSLAHELNQPLCANKLNLDTLKQVAADQPKAAVLTRLLEDVENDNLRVEKIVQRVDKLFRRGTAEFGDIQLSSLVHDCCDLLSKDLGKLNIQVSLNLQNDVHVFGDHGQIETVVLNLLTNAMDALKDVSEERLIQIQTHIHEQRLTLSFVDNGIGVSPSALAQIFDPFFTSKDHGMGVGLWLAKSIIEHHDAQLTASPNPYGGARFDIVFSNFHHASAEKIMAS